MKTLKRVFLEVVEVEFIDPKYMEFGEFYYSREYGSSNHLCVCGCGKQTPLPIKENGWSLVINDNKPTITPSILQRHGCQSHYIITNGIANIV